MNFSSIFKSISNFQFPYSLEQDSIHENALWEVFQGTRKSDSHPVTVFKAKRNPDSEILILNAVQKAKVLKIPGLCSVLETFDSDAQSTFIITERVEPFPWDSLNNLQKNPESLQLGISQILTTLQLLSNFIVGNISKESVYINSKGQWLLFGLELCCNIADVTSNQYLSSVDRYYSITGFSKPNNDIRTFDSIKLAELIKGLFGSLIPKDWQSLITSLNKGSLSIKQFQNKVQATQTWNKNSLISIDQELNELHIKDPQGKMVVMITLQNLFLECKELFSHNTPNFLEGLIIPELCETVTWLMTHQASSPTTPAKIVSFLAMLLTLTSESNYFPDQFKELVLNVFKLPDRQIRFLLLIFLPNIIGNLTETEISNRIFPQFAQGLADSDSTLRLQTLKTIPSIVPSLTERQLNNELLRYLAKTQVDPDVEIRTWTIIIITRVSSTLSTSSNRASILATAFTKSLKDPDIKPRLASLYGLEKSIDLLDVNTIANKILTVIAPGLLDKHSLVRSKAKALFNKYLNKLEAEAEKLQEKTGDSNEKSNDINFDAYDIDDDELSRQFMENLRMNSPQLNDIQLLQENGKMSTDNGWDNFETDTNNDNWDAENGWDTNETVSSQLNKPQGKVIKVEESWNDDLDDPWNEGNEAAYQATLENTKRSNGILSNGGIKSNNKTGSNISLSAKKKITQKQTTKLLIDDDVEEDGWDDNW
ncbi:hypothetical protein Kpol_1029p2 [Vanderwaltozyma polyspora DSM 70294]|uniref:Protein kinase domain-containing protein n=1 Tax=Vanderwaltozyma polyspora (strain ATCC 22028 / DSM 70294 / BCRC 21397 / CBS 2163 / NBRC 10782 / NRRL Y-8283 / UCD 57-17) TaxID=436907 RepID=A7TR61_VANPO|nr:uncharacterized protein Kpol_1029p2 [Vanderwaltozyma polyspora DSM 70294]EDO15229.1 hypothetical protein Kpol_1029p2 [Vanderwaltozyma polyspora DSM 70294]